MWIGILQLIIINLILSIDNAVLIALSTKDLSDKNRKIAKVWGVIGAILLRFVFIIFIIFIFSLIGDKAYGVFLLFGVALITIGLLLTTPKEKKEAKIIENVWKSIGIILLADAMMSLENSIIVVNNVMKINFSNDLTYSWELTFRILIVLIVLLISIPVIIFGIDILNAFMEKNHWFEYIAAILIIAAGIEMIFEDPLFILIFGKNFEELTNLPNWGTSILSYSIAIFLSSSKYLLFDKYKLKKINNN